MTDETSVIEAILNDVDNSGLPGCARIADISEARWQLLVERLAQALRESGEDGLTGNL